jgi:mono/diheme cytochrome c family protein
MIKARADWRRFFVSVVVLIAAATEGASALAQDAVARGRYLATAANCQTCHTRSGGKPYEGGLPVTTDFGVIYSTNITSHPQAGIGRWTLAQFVRAFREGVDEQGQHLYPAFPYTAFTRLTDADLADLYAYFKTVPASAYRAPDNDMRFPFGQRQLLGPWKSMFFESARFTPRQDRSAEWNRGAYLVEALGHCGACHSPRNLLGAEKTDQAMAGGWYYDKIPGGVVRRWSAVNLTQAQSGLRAWSIGDLTSYLKTGHGTRAGSFGPMNEVIENSTRNLSDADVRAMAVYLKSLPAVERSDEQSLSDRERGAGETLYTIHCGTCHLPTGAGAKPGEDLGPPLAGSAVVQSPEPYSLINIILYGTQVITPTPPKAWKNMKPLYDSLDDDEVAQIANYLRSSWGNRGGKVTEADVAEQRSDDE